MTVIFPLSIPLRVILVALAQSYVLMFFWFCHLESVTCSSDQATNPETTNPRFFLTKMSLFIFKALLAKIICLSFFFLFRYSNVFCRSKLTSNFIKCIQDWVFDLMSKLLLDSFYACFNKINIVTNHKQWV